MRTAHSATDLYRQITQKIIAAIEAGADDFVMPWHARSVAVGRPTNAGTARPYHGVNVVALWAEAVLAGYRSGYWATYRQWSEAGAQVRKGERGAVVVFYKPLGPDRVADDDDEARPARRVLRSSYVFNHDQVDGWATPDSDRPPLQIDTAFETFIGTTGARIEHGGDMACYVPARDLIRMPDRGAFRGSATSTPLEAYCATLLHELVHWSGAEHRLNRTFGRYGDPNYAMEELVAELGSAFLCADHAIANEPRADHAADIADWLKILGEDSRAIFRAAAAADLAVRFLDQTTTSER